MDLMKQRITEAFRPLDVELQEYQAEDYVRFYHMLTEKNKVMNLTAITEFEDVLAKHFVDSASLALVLNELKGDKSLRIMDMGCGAGFPGIPLRIAFPQHQYVLSDALNKRIKFIREYIDDRRYTGIEAVHGRAEELARKKEYREQFDLCTSRAVAALPVLCEYCLPFVKIGGYMAAYKGGDCGQEIEESREAVKKLGGEILPVKPFRLPGTDMDRSIVMIKKVSKTPAKYPRKPGTPAKEPIKKSS